jgi:hypothetical protein
MELVKFDMCEGVHTDIQAGFSFASLMLQLFSDMRVYGNNYTVRAAGERKVMGRLGCCSLNMSLTSNNSNAR